jgi:TolA-binding protein
MEAKTKEDLYLILMDLSNLYFSENKYSEFVEFLSSLAKQKKELEPAINYYIALSRYSQLKYLEEKQNWDEYFSNGNAYRQEITEAAGKTISSTSGADTLNIYARLILWQFHRDQQDVFWEQALSDLMSSISEYVKTTQDPKTIKYAADKLLAYGEKGKAKELYKIYVDKIITSAIIDDRLKETASTFYKEGNPELAEALYDVYIDRIVKSAPKEKLIPTLIGIAKDFSYKDEGLKDALYAEKIFKKIEEIGTKDVFDEELMYLRAFNLEKAKDYLAAKDLYRDLVSRYPSSIYADEANYKIGIILTYILRDINTGKSYFEKLAQKETLSAQVISSLYQLGLLSQWEQDNTKAKEYFNKLLERAKDGFSETVNLAKERLKEIEEAKPIEYNLKTFLDVSLKEEDANFDMTKIDLKSSIYRAKKEQAIDISSTPYIAQTGCLQVELQYLWSGHTGTAKPSLEESAFNTTYIHPGTKEINLIVISASGVVDRNIDLVDVY